MTTANRVIKNTGFLYAKMGITMFISLYTTRLILNALGAEDFGIFNIVGGAIAMLGFLNAAMAGATQRFMSYTEGEGNKEKQKKIFNISFVLHLGIALLMGIVLLIAGYFFFNGILNIAPERMYAAKVVYTSLIVSTVFTVMTVPYDAVLNAHENMLYYSIVGIVESLLKLGAAVAVVYAAGDKLVLYGILMACIPLITMTIMRIYCLKNYTECVIAPKRYWDKTIMKEMTSFAGWSFWGSTVSMISNYGQGLIVNVFFGTIVNAAQGISNQISGQLNVFSTNMLKALNPMIVKREGAGNRKEMLDISLTGSKFSYALLAIFSIPLIIEMPYVLNLWLKNVPEYAVVFCRLLLVRMLIEQFFSTLVTSISATGKIKQFQITLSIIAIFPLITTVIFFYFGYEPWILYVIYIVFVLIRSFGFILYFSKKICGLDIANFLVNVVFKNLIVSIISIMLSLIPYCLFRNHLLEQNLSTIFIFLICFPILFYFISLNNIEKNILKKVIYSLKFLRNKI